MDSTEAKSKLKDAWTLITRIGSRELWDWLSAETDYFRAPASSRHRLAICGGLMIHHVNVFSRLLEISRRDLGYQLTPQQLETVAILGLLHDVCLVNCYHKETGYRVNPRNGNPEQYTRYVYRDPFPLGHGEKSIFLISCHMPLTDEEALAIRWHSTFNGSRSKSMIFSSMITPWVWRLQEANLCAILIDEGYHRLPLLEPEEEDSEEP